MRTRTTALTAAAAATLLALTGCASVSDTGGSGSGGDGGSKDSNTEQSPESTEPDWVSESDPQARLSGCLPGTWRMVNESWAAELQSMFLIEGGADSAEVVVTGDLDLVLAASGEYTMTASEHIYDIVSETQGAQVDLTVSHDGTQSGDWLSEGGDRLELNSTSDSGFTSSARLMTNGTAMSVDVESSPVNTDPWAGTLATTCEIDELVTTVQEKGVSSTVSWRRVG